jgi:hypothetical protein
VVPAARLELARLAAADFESATSTDFVTRAGEKLPMATEIDSIIACTPARPWAALRQ